MHKLQGLESVYGGKGFSDDALDTGAKKVWAELEKVLVQNNCLNYRNEASRYVHLPH